MTRNEENINKIFSEIKPVNPVDNIDRTKDDLIHRNDYEDNNQKEKTGPSKFDKMLEEEENKLTNSLTVDEFDEIVEKNLPYNGKAVEQWKLAKNGDKDAWNYFTQLVKNEPKSVDTYQNFWMPKFSEIEKQLFSSLSVKSSRRNNIIKSSNDNSKLYTVEEFVSLISADTYDKDDFIDWVKEGIHGHDKLSTDRWMEIWNDRQSQFTSVEDSTDEDEFTVYTDDKEITVRKEDDHKWHGSDGKTFMGYLKPQDVLHWYRQDYGKAWIDSSRQIKSEIDHFYNRATNYIYGDEISEDEWDDVARYQVEEDYYLTPQRTRVNTYTIYSPNGEYLDQVSDTTKILDVVKKHLKLMDSEKDRLNSSLIKSSYEDAFIVYPWDRNQVTGTSDEDLGLSYVVEVYGDEFVNVDDNTLDELKDTLVRYFDDEAYVRDWNINNPDYQIEDAYEVVEPEELDVNILAMYFDYEAYGRDMRLEHNMVWDSEEECWVSAHDVDDNELNDNKYIFMRG